ncbi:MAG TPA: DUF58 domain-containing protein [Tepidisphaeraceae bacterium]|jgi:uncharacterized protein (DUF58 family)|nr:DUF58 domain-containing protein [Tepidisphaeraceae bacterium]
MPRDPSNPAASKGRRHPSLDFSITGLIYCGMTMFMGFAAMNTQANLLFGVFGLMTGILLLSGIVSRIMLRKLSVKRDFPKHGVVGEPMTLFYKISNGKRFWPSVSVSVVEWDGAREFVGQPQCYMLHVAPRMTATVPVEWVWGRRGLHALDRFQLVTSFPFGFVKRAVMSRHKDVICIFPPLAEVDQCVLAMCRSADDTGEASRPRAGGVDEFYGVREFRPGDNPRHIYWRRSARTGVLVSKDMTRVSPPRLMLLVDTYMPDSSDEKQAAVERVIAMAASIVNTALGQELAVGVWAWAGEAVWLSPLRGKQQREDVLTLLARLPVNSTFPNIQLLDKGEGIMKAGATLVLLTAADPNLTLPDHARGQIVVLSAASENVRSWFRFLPGVRFDVR